MNTHEPLLIPQDFGRCVERKVPLYTWRLCRNTRNLIDVMLSKAKHLAFSDCYKREILRLRPQNDITTQPLKREDVRSRLKDRWFATLFLLSTLAGGFPLNAAEPTEPIIAAAKKEGDEIVFVAGAQTFGGRKGLAELETGFNKRFGLKTNINFAAGPDMNARAARLITEVKAGRKSSTDLYLGSQSHFALLHKENALEKVNWAGTFPWLTKEMEIFPGEGVLVYTSPNGIIYNSNLIPKDKAPKSYADLVDPRLSPNWAGKLAIPPYVAWLAELSLAWGQEKVKDFARKLVAISGGRLRYSEEERIVSGEFPIMANIGDALGAMWTWQAKGAPLVAVPGLIPINTDYFQLGVPKNAAHPNLAKLFVAFMASKEAQAVLQKYESRSSHLVEGTMMGKYLRENRVALQEPKESISYYLKGDSAEGLQFKEDLAKILKQ